MKLFDIAIIISSFALTIILGVFLSAHSIPNQEGYFELAWNFAYINFKNLFSSSAATPLIFITSIGIHKYLPISLASAWKLMDLTFAGFITAFLSWIYISYQKPSGLRKLFGMLVSITSFGYIYSFTSMSGEGMPIFSALLGTYLLSKRKFYASNLFFVISFLSKFTFYLIAPGIFLWGIINFKSFTKKERVHILINGCIFLILFFLYHYSKSFMEIKLQFPYVNSVSIFDFTGAYPFFFLAVLLGAPLVSVFSFINISIKNIFFLSALSVFFILLRRYFYWNHSQQIIVFLFLYAFTHPKAKNFFSVKAIILQLLISLSIIIVLPITAKTLPLFPKHIQTGEMRQVENEILKDYHGGKVGYYLNRPFDEPFPAYEISYLSDTDKATIMQTEYVVIPTIIGIPFQLRNQGCIYIYSAQININTIYRLNCLK